MKRLLMIIGLGGFLLNASLYAQRSYCRESNTVLRVLEDYHFQPREKDQALSGEWFWRSLKAFDPQALYFTQEDIIQLKRYEYRLFKPEGRRCDYFEAVNELMDRRLKQIDHWVDSLSSRPELYQDLPLLTIVEDDLGRYAPDETALKVRWQSWLQYQTLRAWFRQDDADIYSKEDLFLASVDSLWQVAKNRLECDLAGLRSSLGDELGVRWLNSLAECYDPHSTYFSPTEAGNFEADLSTETYSFGLEVSKNEDGEVEVSSLTPGGPAWKSNELNQGDVVISIQLKGDDTPINLDCYDLDELTTMIRGSESDQLVLKVRKSSGQTQTVTLEREVMAVEENRLTGFVLEGDRKVGYIYLPGFYTDWDDSDRKGRGLANDVAREILKLRIAGIEGLIVDLRYNGGGAMNEAIDLAGIFIDEGPIALYKDQEGGPYYLKDENRGMAYDGPLVVMVNGLSASASEIFAAAIQDYHRGLIVGDPTFGKASGQIIIPLAEINGLKGANGILKVTTDRFYRVTQGTHQATGVLPDLLIPDVWSGVMPREVDYDRAFGLDSLEKPVHFNLSSPLPVAELKGRQVARSSFKDLEALKDTIPVIWDLTDGITPTFDTYLYDIEQIDKVYSKVDSVREALPIPFKASNHPQAEALLGIDEGMKARNDRQLERIQEDGQIAEAFSILNDLIELIH